MLSGIVICLISTARGRRGPRSAGSRGRRGRRGRAVGGVGPGIVTKNRPDGSSFAECLTAKIPSPRSLARRTTGTAYRVQEGGAFGRGQPGKRFEALPGGVRSGVGSKTKIQNRAFN